jgi:type II secretory pathway pseudopilin PulG
MTFTGFTLVELIVWLIVGAIVGAAILVVFLNLTRRAPRRRFFGMR